MADRFEALQTFVAVCDSEGFAAAARRLEMSPPAVTRAVAGLEARLGVRLLQRTTRSVKVTEAGGRLLGRARAILTQLAEAEAAAQDEHAAPGGLLVVAASDVFGRLRVAPLVSRYLALYPRASAELRLANSFASLVAEEVDVAIRLGTLPDSALVARRLGETRRVLVASPGYLARGTPEAPADLAGHTLVAFRGVIPRRDWPFAGGSVRVEPRFYSDAAEPAIAHALAGGGILSALAYQVETALGDGRLVEVLASHAAAPVPIHALVPTSRLLSRKVRAFLDLVEAARPSWASSIR